MALFIESLELLREKTRICTAVGETVILLSERLEFKLDFCNGSYLILLVLTR